MGAEGAQMTPKQGPQLLSWRAGRRVAFRYLNLCIVNVPSICGQSDMPGRAEAIRRLVQLGLKLKSKS